jgi:hypothetical protein
VSLRVGSVVTDVTPRYIGCIYRFDISTRNSGERQVRSAGGVFADVTFIRHTVGRRCTIQQLTIRLPRDVGEAMGTLAFATGEPVDEHVLHALRDYLDECGHRAAVTGFTDRARERFRSALDDLKGL